MVRYFLDMNYECYNIGVAYLEREFEVVVKLMDGFAKQHHQAELGKFKNPYKRQSSQYLEWAAVENALDILIRKP